MVNPYKEIGDNKKTKPVLPLSISHLKYGISVSSF
jgi:hypothetical protein